MTASGARAGGRQSEDGATRKGGKKPKRGEAGGEEPRPGRSAAEWASLGISLTIVLILVGLMSFQQFAGGSRPPTIEGTPRMERVRRAGDAYYVPVEIANRGDLTAEDVRVRLSHASDGGRQQSSELHLDYLAGGAIAKGTVVFGEDPARGALAVDMLSFLEP